MYSICSNGAEQQETSLLEANLHMLTSAANEKQGPLAAAFYLVLRVHLALGTAVATETPINPNVSCIQVTIARRYRLKVLRKAEFAAA
jgi:hypothetical protein